MSHLSSPSYSSNVLWFCCPVCTLPVSLTFSCFIMKRLSIWGGVSMFWGVLTEARGICPCPACCVTPSLIPEKQGVFMNQHCAGRQQTPAVLLTVYHTQHWVYRITWPHPALWSWGLNSGLRLEQQVFLLTEPSPVPRMCSYS